MYLKINAHRCTFSGTLFHVFARESCRQQTFPRKRSLISVTNITQPVPPMFDRVNSMRLPIGRFCWHYRTIFVIPALDGAKHFLPLNNVFVIQHVWFSRTLFGTNVSWFTFTAHEPDLYSEQCFGYNVKPCALSFKDIKERGPSLGLIPAFKLVFLCNYMEMLTSLLCIGNQQHTGWHTDKARWEPTYMSSLLLYIC